MSIADKEDRVLDGRVKSALALESPIKALRSRYASQLKSYDLGILYDRVRGFPIRSLLIGRCITDGDRWQ